MPANIILKQALDIIKTYETETNNTIPQEMVATLTFLSKKMEGIELHEGNTQLEQLLVGKHIVMVNGNLQVAEGVKDSNGVDASLLIVLGDLDCKSLMTFSHIFVLGDLSVSNVLLADSGCNHTLKVGGNLTAATILEYGHCIIAGKKIKAKDIYSFNAIEDQKGGVKSNLKEKALIDELVDTSYGERIADRDKTISYIENGGTTFRK